jgi:hypothetical protein
MTIGKSGRINMEIIVRNENKKDYGRVEEITRKALCHETEIGKRKVHYEAFDN